MGRFNVEIIYLNSPEDRVKMGVNVYKNPELFDLGGSNGPSRKHNYKCQR